MNTQQLSSANLERLNTWLPIIAEIVVLLSFLRALAQQMHWF